MDRAVLGIAKYRFKEVIINTFRLHPLCILSDDLVRDIEFLLMLIDVLSVVQMVPVIVWWEDGIDGP